MLSQGARETAVALGSSGVGAGAFAGLSAMDAQGQLGTAPLPQLGGFGTVTGLVALALGIPAVLLGVAGAVGKGPLKRHPDASAGSAVAGTIFLAGQAVATAAGAPSTTVPLVLAKRAGANGAGRGGFAAPRAGQSFLLPPGIQPQAPTGITSNQRVAGLLSG